MADTPEKPQKPKLPPLKKRWECAAKALDLFEGTTLRANYLHHEGEYCAIGAMLHVAGVKEVEQASATSDDTELYKEFTKRFGISAGSIYSINDNTGAESNEERLLYMRAYARARAEGKGQLRAYRAANTAVQASRTKSNGG